MRFPARWALALIWFYRNAISAGRPPACRYTPTCSAYAAEAIEGYGLASGSWLALRRLLRCHPLHTGGHDPVPPLVAQTGSGPAVPPGRPRATARLGEV